MRLFRLVCQPENVDTQCELEGCELEGCELEDGELEDSKRAGGKLERSL